VLSRVSIASRLMFFLDGAFFLDVSPRLVLISLSIAAGQRSPHPRRATAAAARGMHVFTLLAQLSSLDFAVCSLWLWCLVPLLCQLCAEGRCTF
jgi:hypothetical protein